MSDSAHIVPTKLYAPHPRPDLVGRLRLTAHLDDGLRQGHRLFLCSAPAGYGKTTLLSAWLYQGSHPFAWLSLDARDNDLRTFGRCLAAALQRLGPSVGASLARLVAAPVLPPPAALAAALLTDLAGAGEACVLVLDDCQELTAPELHELLAAVLEHPYHQLRLVLSTRVDPPLPLARLRARGLLTEVRAADLRFTADEAYAFLQQTMRVPISHEAAQALEARTEGWIASLQLAALSLRSLDSAQIATFVDAFRGSHHYVLGYLGDEVLRLQDEDVREFLRHTAILSRFCAPLCDAVTGRDDSRATLARLEQANLFVVPLDGERVWYRYHHLFADFLRAELELGAPRVAPLHRRAAEWFEAQGLMHDAVEHSIAAQAWDVAGRQLLQVAEEAIVTFDYARVTSWLDALPDPIVRAEPELLLLRALFAYLARPPEVGRRALADLDGIQRARLSPRSWARYQHIRATTAMLREEPAATLMLQEALTLIGDDDPFFRQRTIVALGRAYRLSGETAAASAAFAEAVRLGGSIPGPANSIHATQLLALIHLDQGRRREALALCQMMLADDARGSRRVPPTGDLLLVPLAACAYEANDLRLARELALRGREEYRRYGLQQRGLIMPDQVLVMASAGLGAWEEAWQFFAEVRRLATESRWVAPLLALLEADLRLRLGAVAAAAQLVASAEALVRDLPDEVREVAACTAARLLLAQGRPEDARGRLAPLEAQARAGGRSARLITVHILQALACRALGRHDLASDALGAAAGLAAPEGYLRRFLDEGPAVASMLPAVRDRAPAFVGQLQQAFADDAALAGPPPADAAAADAPAATPLTQQERTILQRLAEGSSYRTIAEQLVISVGTVRWHVHNLYGKLGVANRTQAINRARELGLL